MTPDPFGLLHTAGPEWVHLVGADSDAVHAWSLLAAARVVPPSPLQTYTPRMQQEAVYLRAVAELALKDGVVEAFLLVPPGELLVRCIVRVQVLGGMTTHEVFRREVEQARPAPGTELQPTVVADVHTGAGTAVRMTSLTRPDGTGTPDAPLYSQAHIWWFPDWQSAVVQIGETDDLAGMQPWLASLESLATSATRATPGAPRTLGLGTDQAPLPAPPPVVVVKPIPQPKDKTGLSGCSLTVDRAAGTLTWVAETPGRRKDGPTVVPLTGAGAVATIVVAQFGVGPSTNKQVYGRLLFCDAAGVTLWHGTDYFPGRIHQSWPAHLWGPVSAAGITVSEERFDSGHALNVAHPGGVAKAMGMSTPQMLGWILAAFALVLGVYYVYTVITGN